MDARIEKLSQMLDKHYRHYPVTYKDEETGEEEVVDFKEIINGDISDEERRLIEMIAADAPNLSDEELFEFSEIIRSFKYRAFDEVPIEMVRRGKESWASSIEKPAILQELCAKGNKYATYELYFKYMHGDEENGIFINKRKAKEYYDLAGDISYKDEWDDSDDPGEEYPRTFEYILTGNAEALDGVEALINDLCQ